jgi:hypothetical protein
MITSSVCASLAVINAPVFVYRAVADRVTPYGWHSPAFWLLAAAANVVVGVIGVRLIFRADLRDRRVKQGLCVKCGYDLRATPDKCPECGAIAPRPPAGA